MIKKVIKYKIKSLSPKNKKRREYKKRLARILYRSSRIANRKRKLKGL